MQGRWLQGSHVSLTSMGCLNICPSCYVFWRLERCKFYSIFLFQHPPPPSYPLPSSHVVICVVCFCTHAHYFVNDKHEYLWLLCVRVWRFLGQMPVPGMPQSGQTGQPPYPTYQGAGYPPQPSGYPPPYPAQQGGPGYPPTHNNFGYPPSGGYPPSTASYPAGQAASQFPTPYGGYGNSPSYPASQTSYASTQGSTGEWENPEGNNNSIIINDWISRAPLEGCIQQRLCRGVK